jgi:hypothetical protein
VNLLLGGQWQAESVLRQPADAAPGAVDRLVRRDPVLMGAIACQLGLAIYNALQL